MHVEFVKTKLVDYETYIDVCKVDGQLKTFLMKKAEEPNVFKAIKTEDGDTSDTITE